MSGHEIDSEYEVYDLGRVQIQTNKLFNTSDDVGFRLFGYTPVRFGFIMCRSIGTGSVHFGPELLRVLSSVSRLAGREPYIFGVDQRLASAASVSSRWSI